jgi:hypothetical protein
VRPPHGRDEIPEGYEVAAVPEDPDRWRIEAGLRCRWLEGHPLRGCGRPSVATLRRGKRWYGHCGDHLYGRWIENGQVMHWVLRAIPEVRAGIRGVA